MEFPVQPTLTTPDVLAGMSMRIDGLPPKSTLESTDTDNAAVLSVVHSVVALVGSTGKMLPAVMD